MRALLKLMWDALFGFVGCVFASAMATGVVWGFTLFDAPFWIDFLYWTALSPILFSALFIYVGGIGYSWRFVMINPSVEEEKDAQE